MMGNIFISTPSALLCRRVVMKQKITIITPVHVSSGNMVESYAYAYHSGRLFRYNLEDILTSGKIPLSELNSLLTADSSKSTMIRFFERKVDYRQFDSQYSMACHIKRGNSLVSEQIKTLTRPYIPGSTIKGAVMNSVAYYLLNEKKTQVNEFLKSQYKPNIKRFENNLWEALFDKNFNDVFNMYSSCIICRDVYFKQLILCKQLRLNMRGSSGQNFANLECIADNQTAIGNFIMIDETKKKLLKKQLINNPIYEVFWNRLLNVSDLLIILRRYYQEMAKEDREYFMFHSDDFPENVSEDILDFYDTYSGADKSNAMVRIGKSTNYFYKSVSLFIKNNHPNYYKAHFEVFSPVNQINKPNSPKPIAAKMPNSRTVIIPDEDYYYPAGMIQIEECD